MQRRHRLIALVLVLLAMPGPSLGDSHLSVYDDPRLIYRSQLGLKVTDGTIAKPGEYQAVVGLTYGSDSRPLCTGTIVGQSDIVLTAAHCVCGFILGPHGKPNSNVLVGLSPAAKPRYFLVVGIRNLTTCMNGKAVNQAGRDLAVLKLNKNTGVSPIALASSDQIEQASTFEVAGFGAINYSGNVVDYQKRYAPVPSVSNDCAGTRDGVPDTTVYGCAAQKEIVGGQRRSPDTCRGDSGGPLFVQTSAGSYLIAGVTSRSIRNPPTICGSGGIYERLTDQAQGWIKARIAELNAEVHT